MSLVGECGLRGVVPGAQRGGNSAVPPDHLLAEPELPQISQAPQAAERGLQGRMLLPQAGRRHRLRVSSSICIARRLDQLFNRCAFCVG